MLSRDGRFRWSEGWQKWVPIDPPKTAPAVTPTPVAVVSSQRHEPSCLCTECWNAGQRYGEYLKAKRLEQL